MVLLLVTGPSLVPLIPIPLSGPQGGGSQAGAQKGLGAWQQQQRLPGCLCVTKTEPRTRVGALGGFSLSCLPPFLLKNIWQDVLLRAWARKSRCHCSEGLPPTATTRRSPLSDCTIFLVPFFPDTRSLDY